MNAEGWKKRKQLRVKMFPSTISNLMLLLQFMVVLHFVDFQYRHLYFPNFRHCVLT